MKVKSLSHVRLLATPWTAAYQAPPPMGFFFQARVLEWGAIANHSKKDSNLATIYTTFKEDQVHSSARHTRLVNKS